KQGWKRSPVGGSLVGLVIKRPVGSLRSLRILLNNESREHSQRIRWPDWRQDASCAVTSKVSSQSGCAGRRNGNGPNSAVWIERRTCDSPRPSSFWIDVGTARLPPPVLLSLRRRVVSVNQRPSLACAICDCGSGDSRRPISLIYRRDSAITSSTSTGRSPA